MKKRLLIVALAVVMVACLSACELDTTTTVQTADENEGISLTYTADFTTIRAADGFR